MQELIKPFINLAILLGLLVYFLRQPLRHFVRERHNRLKEEIYRVGNMLRGARARYEEFSSKLKAVDVEISGLREKARQDGVEARRRILAEAKRLSDGIVADAQGAAQMLFTDLKEELYQGLVHKILARAEAVLREKLTGDDQARIRKEFSQEVERAQ